MNIFKRLIKKSEDSFAGVLHQSVELKSSNKAWGSKDFMKAYTQNLYFGKAIDKRAEKVGDVEWYLKKGEQIIEEHEVLDLLNKPNSLYSSGSEFWEMYQKYFDLAGAAFIYVDTERDYTETLGKVKINHKNTKLYLLNPLQVKTKYNEETQKIVGYEYQKEQGGVLPLQPHEVIKVYNHGLENQFSNVSKMIQGARNLDIDNQLSEYQASILQNGGSIDGVMSFDGNLTKAQLDQIKESYKKEYSDAKKSGRPLFLGGKASYNKTAITPQELGYNESKKLTLNDTVILTGVPKVLLGAVDDIKYSNAEESAKVFLKETILPLLNKLRNALNENKLLIPDGFELHFKNDVKEDVETINSKITNGSDNNYMTINERREMAGLDEIENGDRILAPFNLTDINEEREEPQKETPKDKSLKSFDHPLRDKTMRKLYGKHKVSKEEKNEEIFKRAVRTYFKKQKDRLLEGIKEEKSKDLIDEQFNRDIEVNLAVKELLPLMEGFLREAGEDTAKLMGSETNFTLTSEMTSWLDKKANVFAKQINDTTFEKLKGEFAESVANEEPRRQLVKRIEDTYGNISKSRANTIARTEVGGVMTKGTFESYKQMNIPIKIWVSVNDAQTRSSHSMVDGEEKPIDTPFSNGLQYPREAGAPAEEVINCRCQI